MESSFQVAAIIGQGHNPANQEGRLCNCGWQRFKKDTGDFALVVILVEHEVEDGTISNHGAPCFKVLVWRGTILTS